MEFDCGGKVFAILIKITSFWGGVLVGFTAVQGLDLVWTGKEAYPLLVIV